MYKIVKSMCWKNLIFFVGALAVLYVLYSLLTAVFGS